MNDRLALLEAEHRAAAVLYARARIMGGSQSHNEEAILAPHELVQAWIMAVLDVQANEDAADLEIAGGPFADVEDAIRRLRSDDAHNAQSGE